MDAKNECLRFKKLSILFYWFHLLYSTVELLLYLKKIVYYTPRTESELLHGEVLKAKLSPQSLTHQLQRRLLPRTEILQKQINHTQNIRSKSSKFEANDELEIEYNRLPEISNSLYLEEDHSYQGECTNCGDDNILNRWTMPLLKSGEKRYYLGTFFKANWYRAAQYCRYHGMHLASITSQDENDKLEKYITDYGYGHEHFWTGGTDLAEEGSFFWMSSGRPIVFTNWNAGEPNNFKYENGEEEHCLELWNRDGKGLKWNDSPCSFETYFVCET